MAENSSIQWTDHTFNPWRGCTKVSPGCKFCYAERLAGRNPKVLGEWGPQGTRVLAAEPQWREPEKWNRTAEHDGITPLVFCASLADVFEDWPGQMTDAQGRPLFRPPGVAAWTQSPSAGGGGFEPYTLTDARARLWELIRRTPRLRWQLLTKRPEGIARMMPAGRWPNVWLGVSVESQDYAWRLDALQEARDHVECPVGFVSAEPLLGPLSLWDQLPSVQWVIVGGESGGEARPCRVAWVRDLLLQCQDAATPVFVKQLGKVAVVTTGDGFRRHQLPLKHDASHGGDVRDWPGNLRVQQFPLQ